MGRTKTRRAPEKKRVSVLGSVMRLTTDGNPWINIGNSPIPADTCSKKRITIISPGQSPCVSYRLNANELHRLHEAYSPPVIIRPKLIPPTRKEVCRVLAFKNLT